MKRCALCRETETEKRKINKHHIKGKKYPDIMEVHTTTCHWFAQWVTNMYLEAGMEHELSEKLIIYLYGRVINLRHGDDFILHTVR